MSLHLPLCFKYTGPVMGQGFLAHIELCGRLIASSEAEGYWLYGVNPGALSVGAKTLAEGSQAVRDALTRTFIDFAESAGDFDAFRRTVEDYYYATDDDLAEWDRAVDHVKRGDTPLPDGLPRCPDPELYVRVALRKLEDLTPQDNPIVHRENQQLAAVA